MSLYDQALLGEDFDFRQRVGACGTTEGRVEIGVHPMIWAAGVQWHIAAAPTFADKYASALAGGVEHPGRDESVISDQEILSAVQALPPEAA